MPKSGSTAALPGLNLQKLEMDLDAAGRSGDLRRLAALEPLPREFYNRDPRVVARALLGKVLLRRGSPATPGRGAPRGAGKTLRAGRIVETEAYLGANDAAAHAAAGLTQRNAVLFGPPGHAYVYLSYGLHYCLNVSCLPAGRAGCVLIRALEPLAGIAAMAQARGMKFPHIRGAASRLDLSQFKSNAREKAVAAFSRGRIPTQAKRRLEWAARGESPLKPKDGLNGPPAHPRAFNVNRFDLNEFDLNGFDLNSFDLSGFDLNRFDPNQRRRLCGGPARLCQAFEIMRARDNASDLTRPSAGGLWLADDGFRPRRIASSGRVGITKSAELDLRYYVAESAFVSKSRQLRLLARFSQVE